MSEQEKNDATLRTPKRRRQAFVVRMLPSVGVPNPHAVLPLMKRLLQSQQENEKQRRDVHAQFEGSE